MTPPAAAVSASAPQGADRSALWVRAIAALPWWVLYGVAHSLAWLASSVFPYRKQVVHENLSLAFPELDEARLRDLMRRYYRGFAEVLVEIVKSVRLPPDEIRRRVRVEGLDAARALIAGGSPVLLVAAHQCNWEWMLLALTLELSYPLDAAYKPLVDPWAEREMLKLRTRFGSRLVPAKDLLADIIKRRGIVRAVAMVADQEPTASEHMHWTRFLNRDTAFYMGPEELARVTRFPTFFIGLKRTGRGHYEMQFTPLCSQGEVLAPGALTERYARLVEAQIRAAPADWPWSHKRWKLKRSLYENRTRAGG